MGEDDRVRRISQSVENQGRRQHPSGIAYIDRKQLRNEREEEKSENLPASHVKQQRRRIRRIRELRQFLGSMVIDVTEVPKEPDAMAPSMRPVEAEIAYEARGYQSGGPIELHDSRDGAKRAYI